MFCRNCGLLNEPDATHCASCGRWLFRAELRRRKRPLLALAFLLAVAIGIGVSIYGMSADKPEEFKQMAAKPEQTAPAVTLPAHEQTVPASKEAVEILQVLPTKNGSVAVLYSDGTVRLSGNDEMAAAVSGWTQVAKLYYRENYTWENGEWLMEACYIGLKEDGTVLTTDGSLSGWRNIKEIYTCVKGFVAVTHDGRVLAEGDWKDPSFLTDLTNVEELVYGDIMWTWGCLMKDGTVAFFADTDDVEGSMDNGWGKPWTNVRELRAGPHGFYAIKNDGTVEGDLAENCDGLTGAAKVVEFEDWLFGISPEGQLMTHNGGSIYPNTGDIVVDEPGLPYYGEEVDIRQFTNLKDIIPFGGLTLLNRDGTAKFIGYYDLDLGSWQDIQKVYGRYSDEEGLLLYGIRGDGSVIVNWYNGSQDQYRSWQLRELYAGTDGAVGLTLDGRLVGDGIYENLDFSVFDR